MSNDGEFEIPRHASAGIAFLGVDLNDALILIGSIFVALGAGAVLGGMYYIVVPIIGYVLNRIYLDWRTNALPGDLRAKLYAAGIVGYSRALQSRDTVYVGDAVVINPDSLSDAGVVIDGARASAGLAPLERPTEEDKS
jgi:hypothetical protein